MKRENAAGRAADLATAERTLSTLRSSAAALLDTGCDEEPPTTRKPSEAILAAL